MADSPAVIITSRSSCMIIGFIAQSFRNEEHRTRLLLAGPITPRQIAIGMVLLPLGLFAVGIVAAALGTGVGYLITGELDAESVRIVGNVGGLLLAMT